MKILKILFLFIALFFVSEMDAQKFECVEVEINSELANKIDKSTYTEMVNEFKKQLLGKYCQVTIYKKDIRTEFYDEYGVLDHNVSTIYEKESDNLYVHKDSLENTFNQLTIEANNPTKFDMKCIILGQWLFTAYYEIAD